MSTDWSIIFLMAGTDKLILFLVSGRAQWMHLLGHSSVIEIVTCSGLVDAGMPSFHKVRATIFFIWLCTSLSNAWEGMGGIQVEKNSASSVTFTGTSPSKMLTSGPVKRLIRKRKGPEVSTLTEPWSIYANTLKRKFLYIGNFSPSIIVSG